MDELKKYREAGKIARKVRDYGRKLIKPGAKYLDIVDKTENKISELGGSPAFPVNLSIDNIGAHDTADINEDRIIEKEDMIKLDIGVHIDGYIADTATTVPFKKTKMVDAVNKALKEALKSMVPGARVCDISEVIERNIRNYGFNPIKNLTGHGLDRYNTHARLEFPNVKNDNKYRLKEGEVYALEPFCTDGSGMVKETSRTLIYKYMQDKPIRFREGRIILEKAKQNFDSLPFSKRWLNLSPLKMRMALNQLVQNKALYKYPVLKEREDGIIAQSEHTVIVKDKPEIITYP